LFFQQIRRAFTFRVVDFLSFECSLFFSSREEGRMSEEEEDEEEVYGGCCLDLVVLNRLTTSEVDENVLCCQKFQPFQLTSKLLYTINYTNYA